MFTVFSLPRVSVLLALCHYCSLHVCSMLAYNKVYEVQTLTCSLVIYLLIMPSLEEVLVIYFTQDGIVSKMNQTAIHLDYTAHSYLC